MRNRLTCSLLSLVLLAIACSKAPVRPAAAPAITTIRFGTVMPDPRLDPVIAAFQTAHPEYRVEKVPFPLGPALAQSLKDQPADVVPVFAPLTLRGDYKELMDLGPFIAKGRFDTAPLGALLQSETVDGKVYALPAFGMPEVFAYNRELAEKAGVSIPTDRWTWDEFRTVVGQLASGKGDDRIWGFDWGFNDPVNLMNLHARQLTPEGAVPGAEAVRQVFTFWQTVISTDRSAPSFVRGREIEGGPQFLKLDQGKAALSPTMLPTGSFARTLRIAPFPAVGGRKPTALVSLYSLGLAAGSAVPDAAWAFMSYAAGPEGATILARSGQFPVYFTDATRQAWLESGPPIGSEVLFDATLVEPWQARSALGALEVPFMQAADGILAGTADVDAAVKIYATALAKVHP